MSLYPDRRAASIHLKWTSGKCSVRTYYGEFIHKLDFYWDLTVLGKYHDLPPSHWSKMVRLLWLATPPPQWGALTHTQSSAVHHPLSSLTQLSLAPSYSSINFTLARPLMLDYATPPPMVVTAGDSQRERRVFVLYKFYPPPPFHPTSNTISPALPCPSVLISKAAIKILLPLPPTHPGGLMELWGRDSEAFFCRVI